MAVSCSVLPEMARKQPTVLSLFTTPLQRRWQGSLVDAAPLEKALGIYFENKISPSTRDFKKVDGDLAVELQRRVVASKFIDAMSSLNLDAPVKFPEIGKNSLTIPVFYAMDTFDMLHVQNIAEMAWKATYNGERVSDGEKALFSIMYSKLPEYASAKNFFSRNLGHFDGCDSNVKPEEINMLKFFIESIGKVIETFNGILKQIGPAGYPS